MAFTKSDKPVKSLWHSEAVTFGATLCFVKSGPTPSKNSDNPPYFTLDIGDRERYYNCENDGCKATLTGLLHRKAMLEFTGSREEAAILNRGAGADQGPPHAGAPQGQEPPPSQPPQQPGFQAQPRERTPSPRQEPLPPAQQEAEDLKRGKATVTRLANMMGICLDASEFICSQHAAKHPQSPPFTKDNICSIAATLQIGAERNGAHNMMPEHLIERPAAKGGAK